MSEMDNPQHESGNPLPFPLPRVTIQFCTQCKWLLRAAYYAQELISTFSTSLGEVALQPATGGVFVVEIISASPGTGAGTGTENENENENETSNGKASGVPTPRSAVPRVQRRVLWDRKIDGGFPETKELKRRIRDVIQPGRNLGHVDRDYGRQSTDQAGGRSTQPTQKPDEKQGKDDGIKEGDGTKGDEKLASGGHVGGITCTIDGKCEDCE